MEISCFGRFIYQLHDLPNLCITAYSKLMISAVGTLWYGEKMQELINTYTVTIEIPIAWGDMDAFQHVNNTVYFKLFESARISYFEQLDFIEFMNETGIGPILASTQCRYKIPLTYPDHVTVGASVDTIEKDRFIMKYAVISHKHKKIAALGEGTLVTFDYRNNKKALIPDEIRKRIIDLEKSMSQDIHGTE
ncbi:MAG: thioesterase family protein [Desulfobacterales bacterium]|jgi:acyl-CoA thioester hydrolase